MINAADSLRGISSALIACGIEDAARESEIIFTGCTGFDRLALYRDQLTLSETQASDIRVFLDRRKAREPLQYIAGHTDFYGLEIKVGPGVLIPRPETELLVEEAITAVSSCKLQASGENNNSALSTPHSALRILDLCTGSGCIAVALAKHFPAATVYGTDISGKALEYAEENAKTHNAGNTIFLKGNLYEPVKNMIFDLIISNPPYIRRPDIIKLQPEIREWEPFEALDGGDDGLIFYRRILSEACGYLKKGGVMLLEIGEGQARDVAGIAEDSGLKCVSVIKDYAGIERHLRLENLDF